MTATLDLTAVKTRMKATWEAGDYATFATYEEGRNALRRDLVDVFEQFDRGADGTSLLEGEFLSVEIVR